jgi:HPt (histidine-containing phosphotransfer) domain-containing protein
MESVDKTVHIDLTNVIGIARGDEGRYMRYLNQFVELVSSRSVDLQSACDQGEPEAIRKVVHSMKPQLQFFGVTEIDKTIESLEEGIAGLSNEDIERECTFLLKKLDLATAEIKDLIPNGQ